MKKRSEFLGKLGSVCKKRREDHKITQKQVADANNTSVTQVNRFENGEHYNDKLANYYTLLWEVTLQ